MTSQRRGELEQVIGEVAASYGAGRLIDSLSSAQLPNKRQVIEALNHLKAVMYLGYYSTGSLDESKLRFALASHLYPAYEILVEQIGRAASYEGFRSAGVPRDQDWPETVTVALLRKVPAIRALLSKDVIAAFQGDPAANSVEEVIFSYRRSRRSPPTASRTSSTASACPCSRASWRSTRTRTRASTSTPAPRSASRSSSTTARAS